MSLTLTALHLSTLWASMASTPRSYACVQGTNLIPVCAPNSKRSKEFRGQEGEDRMGGLTI